MEVGNDEKNKAPKAMLWYSIITDQELIIKYMMEKGLLLEEKKCETCGSMMNLCKRKDISDLLQWKCPSCLSTCSIRRNTIFEVCVQQYHY